MTMPSKGNPISLLDLQNEFGGSNPISMSEYYGSGFPVSPTTGVPFYALGWPNGLSQPGVTVPNSGTIPLDRYYSAGALYRFEYLIVGGGGGGGSGWPDNIGGGGGGGGGGGVSWGSFTLNRLGLTIVGTVGAGGAGASYPTTVADSGQGSNLAYSSKQYAVLNLWADGGQGGRGRAGAADYNGGAGGQGTYAGNAGGAYNSPGGSNGLGAGGGGGGVDDADNTAGVGGAGVRWSFSDALEGTAFYWGGGGGGGGDYSLGAAGGAGGGGQGGSGNMSVTAGTANRGGGGGGGSSTGGGSWGPGASGGSGIVCVAHRQSYPFTLYSNLIGGSKFSATVGGVPYWIYYATSTTTWTVA